MNKEKEETQVIVKLKKIPDYGLPILLTWTILISLTLFVYIVYRIKKKNY